MNATIARLHRFDPAEIGLSDFGRGENYVARQVDRWSKQYRASQTADDRRDGAADRMAAGAHSAVRPGAARARRLPARQHDLRHAIEPHVLAVLDWELSTLGDPLADFSYHLMQWHMPPEETGAGTGSLVGHDLDGARHSVAGGLRRHVSSRAPASIRGRIWRPISPTISSASPRSCRASPAACATAPRPASTRRRRAQMVRPLAETAWRFAREAGAR